MGYLLFIIIIFAIFAWAVGFVGYNKGIIIPVLIVMAIIVAIIRAVVIKRENSY